jgi:hypothetical protein
MKVKLELPVADFDRLHEIAARSGRQKAVRVNRDALAVMLSDYTRLYSACEEAGITIIDPPEEMRIDRSVPWEMPAHKKLAGLKSNGGGKKKANENKDLNKGGSVDEPSLFSNT